MIKQADFFAQVKHQGTLQIEWCTFTHDSLLFLFPFYRKQKFRSEFIFITSFTLSVFMHFNGMKESTLKPIIISVVLYVLPQS